MNTNHFCQSCSMPMESDELRGSEKDGSHSPLYCKYCYSNGEFTDKEMSLSAMKDNVRIRIENMHIPGQLKEEMITLSEQILPELIRWKTPELAKNTKAVIQSVF